MLPAFKPEEAWGAATVGILMNIRPAVADRLQFGPLAGSQRPTDDPQQGQDHRFSLHPPSSQVRMSRARQGSDMRKLVDRFCANASSKSRLPQDEVGRSSITMAAVAEADVQPGR